MVDLKREKIHLRLVQITIGFVNAFDVEIDGYICPRGDRRNL
jgi:hypothetical protein